MDWVAILEWSGSLCGLMGAFLLASHTRLSRYGWVAFLVANIAMVGFAMGIGRYGLLVQQLGFMATSMLGIYRAGFTLPFLGSRDRSFARHLRGRAHRAMMAFTRRFGVRFAP